MGSAWLAAEADAVLARARGSDGGGGGFDSSHLRPAALLGATGDIADVLCEVIPVGPGGRTTWVVVRVEIR